MSYRPRNTDSKYGKYSKQLDYDWDTAGDKYPCMLPLQIVAVSASLENNCYNVVSPIPYPVDLKLTPLKYVYIFVNLKKLGFYT